MIVLILVGLIFIAGAATNRQPSIDNVTRIDTPDDNLYMFRVHDSATNVTCWLDASGKLSTSNGISCLPDYMLNRPGDYNGN